MSFSVRDFTFHLLSQTLALSPPPSDGLHHKMGELEVTEHATGTRIKLAEVGNSAGHLPLGDGQLQADTVWKARESVYLLKLPTHKGLEETYVLTGCSPQADQQLQNIVLRCRTCQSGSQGRQEKAPNQDGVSTFARKTEAGSADSYFRYYGMLQHQQNMLQDYVRTGTYYSAIMENRADFEGKVVMDVGCGSGILSLFAAQAGAKKVFAVEASDMADFARQLAASNPGFGDVIEVVKGKVEEINLQCRVDVLISEPMGTLLVNERMLETYLFARNRFLKPGGRMYPQLGRVHVAAFSDEILYQEVASKSSFWAQPNFFGVDITRLHRPATSSYFSQVVVDAIDPALLVSGCVTKVFDFGTMAEEELYSIRMPLLLQAGSNCMVHGIACWFDVLFDGSTSQRWLSTAPGLPTTHWFQLRCIMHEPLQVAAGGVVHGELHLEAHNRQSYDIRVTLTAPPLLPGAAAHTVTAELDLKEPYYRQLNSWWQPATGQQQPVEEGYANGSVTHHVPAESLWNGQAVANNMS
ncbi:hypothetical protein WJX72_001569 [[Myrmecia] bisecta]|uniref:type I protein arginine methyltransferase n=1 Tax=[Myrmecia] bisecta TaxID=41462 RepID=A0AAW1Q5J0_9CHLO